MRSSSLVPPLFVALIALASCIPSSALAQAPQPSWAAVDQALGRSGAAQPDGVHRYSFPRTDLKVTLDGIALKPGFALGSWVAFEPMGDQAMVMGDLVLTHDEVNPVVSALLAGGFTITALHNHLLRAQPATMYMHISGHGRPADLAATLHAALAKTGTPLGAPASAPPPRVDLDTAALDRIMGMAGKANGGIYQFSVPRPETVTEGGMPAPATMGTATGINFQPLGSGKAAVTGDFVMIGPEVDPVMRALRAGGIEITALHNHMIDEQPRLFFMHFWGHGDAQQLARGLRSAVDSLAKK
jgi:hypothetical protein